MLDVDAVVDHGHDDLALAARELPGGERVHVLALLLPARAAAVVEVPLRRGRRGQAAAVLRDEVRRREEHLVEGGALVGHLQQHVAAAGARPVHDDHLIPDEGIAPAQLEPEPVEDGGPRRLARARAEADRDLVLEGPHEPGRALAERHRRRAGAGAVSSRPGMLRTGLPKKARLVLASGDSLASASRDARASSRGGSASGSSSIRFFFASSRCMLSLPLASPSAQALR